MLYLPFTIFEPSSDEHKRNKQNPERMLPPIRATVETSESQCRECCSARRRESQDSLVNSELWNERRPQQTEPDNAPSRSSRDKEPRPVPKAGHFPFGSITRPPRGWVCRLQGYCLAYYWSLSHELGSILVPAPYAGRRVEGGLRGASRAHLITIHTAIVSKVFAISISLTLKNLVDLVVFHLANLKAVLEPL